MKSATIKRNVSLLLAAVMLLALVPTMFTASAADFRETEPNDTFSTATVMQLGATYAGRLDDDAQRDYYTFTVPSNGSIKVTFNFTAGNPNMLLKLYDSNQDFLTDWSLRDRVYPLVSDRIRIPAGTYYLFLDYLPGFNKTDDYTLRVDFTSEAGQSYELEPNNAFSTATQLTIGQDIKGGMDATDKIDYYAFTIPNKGSVTFTYNFTAGNPNMLLKLYDSSHTFIADWSLRDRVYPMTSNRIRVPAGTYYLFMDYLPGYNQSDDYTLRVDYVDESTGTYESEVNNSFSTATQLPINTTIIGGLADNDKVDYYKFDLPTESEVNVIYNFTAGNPNMQLKLYDSSSKQLYSESLRDRPYPMSRSQRLAAGTYYIFIDYMPGFNVTDDYTLAISVDGVTPAPARTSSGGTTQTPVPPTTTQPPETTKPTDPTQPSGPVPPTNPVTGMSGWATAEVNEAIALGFVPAELQYDFQRDITRAEFSKLVVHMLMAKSSTLGYESTFIAGTGIDMSTSPFTDTSDTYVKMAYGLLIVNGRGNGQFDPYGNISRQDAATMLKRAASVFEFTENKGTALNFDDKGSIAAYAASAVDFCSANGIMNGMTATSFGPHSGYTREQSIVTMLRLFKAFPRDSYPLV